MGGIMLSDNLAYELDNSNTDRLEELIKKECDPLIVDAINEELYYRSY